MPQPKSVPQLMNCFFQDPLTQEGGIGPLAVKEGIESGDGDKAVWAASLSLAEDEIKARGIEIHIGDAQDSKSIFLSDSSHFYQYPISQILSSGQI